MKSKKKRQPSRPGYPLPDLKKLAQDIPGLSKRVIIMDKPQMDISATEIRKRLSRGKPIDDLVPKAVAEYIKRQRLYLRA